jgi:antitoxin component YwqK of YwqJK toxin-antitoxin module
MRSILLIVLFLCIPKLCISQVITANDDAVYLDSLFNMGTEKNYKYIRVVKNYNGPRQESYEVKDFYKSGKIAMSGSTTKRDKIIKTGMFVYYYENGNKKSVANYILDKKDGKYFEFYENGNKKEEGEYTGNKDEPGKNYKLNQYWDENSKHVIIDGNGNYSCENKTGYIETGKYENGFKDGIHEGKNLKYNTSFVEKYENGKFISGTRTFTDNTKSEYFELEKKPVPKRGMEDFYKFIGKNYRLPNQQGLKGKVYITFVVEKDGKIAEPKVLRDLGYGTGTEAIRVVMAYDGFSPGEQRGQKVRCTFSLPITIQSAN